MQQTGLRQIAVHNGTRETVASKGTGDKQRIYDAMLIRAFRKDVRMTDLQRWLNLYGIDLEKDGLARVPKNIWWTGRVQEMVGRYLKPLADRLWDTTDDIKTLNWMNKLNCDRGYTNRDKDVAKLKKQSNRDRKKGGILMEAWDSRKRTNQWNVVK